MARLVAIGVPFAIFKPFGAELKNILRLGLDNIGHESRKHWLHLLLEVGFVAVALGLGQVLRVRLFHKFEYV